LLLIADEMGFVRIQDISNIVSEFNLNPVDLLTGNLKRNPWRVLSIEKAETGNNYDFNDATSDNSDVNRENEVEPLLKEF